MDNIEVEEEYGIPSIENFDTSCEDDNDETNDKVDIAQQDEID